jgi:hypothetical protein
MPPVLTLPLPPLATHPPTDEDAQRRVSGNAVRISQGAGWVFGDVALLFNSPRTASVVAASDVVLWAMDRPTFLTLVMKHAQGARTLRFVRKVPLLKGLSDNDLLRVAGRMPERSYEDGQALIRYGERGDEMYLIRYGKVGGWAWVAAVVVVAGVLCSECAVSVCGELQGVSVLPGILFTPGQTQYVFASSAALTVQHTILPTPMPLLLHSTHPPATPCHHHRCGCWCRTARAGGWRWRCWGAASSWGSAPSSTTACAAPM